MMRRFLLFLVLLLLIHTNRQMINGSEVLTISNETSEIQALFTEMNLTGVVNYTAFEQAMIGYKKICEKKKEILTLIDFSKPSSEERLYVFDVKQKKVLYTSIVSHGRNSGSLYATSFSNKSGSFKSSLGFYLTMNTYNGKNGYSLVLEGLEKGINDKARERAIVMHGASYSDPSVISSSGRLGRSLGCPALPLKVCKKIINEIKDGSLLYIYADNNDYLTQSSIL
ncbi:murein L,D-transpeptidase catalytic domain family protein [Bacteroides sp. 214]|uniref:murein L,D-transpeptidase catalytic domain family protein n=1 Tax=Bacteroides sp. 214 TaxID=2302935 RepID=UPI0013D63D49|nr:murein L,D-transpeptidase catalytic domain family protein [Bacteroides sp. 214]